MWAARGCSDFTFNVVAKEYVMEFIMRISEKSLVAIPGELQVNDDSLMN